MSLPAGTRLGPYEIVAPLGSGGMGEVYKARDARLDRFVAIKVLPADKLADPERKRRFVQEARSASALNHPNIVTIYDVGSENGVEYLAMELVDGRTLDDLTPRDGFRIPELLRYAVQAADALTRAHAAGIVHRDLKPGNLMVTRDGLVKVLDFGLAKLVRMPGEHAETSQAVTAASDPGLVVGTASFMSPEQAEGKPIDARSDIFSFGAVLYEMATGQRAFRGDSPMSTISAILRDEPKPITDIRREIPSELERVIRRCLRKDPARRFQTMADLKVALEELKEESDSGSLSAVARAAAPVAAAKRIPWLAFGAVALAAAALAGGLALRRVPPPSPAMQRPSPLTAYPGDEVDPSFSPDGSQVAFTWNGDKQDNYDIYLKVVGAGAPLRLTTDPLFDVAPKWSPDGRAIAFVRGDVNLFQLMVIPALGGPERVVARFTRGRRDTLIDWTPDGQRLVVAADAGDGSIRMHLVSVDSGETRPLTTPPPSTIESDPVFSPDGRLLAFTRLTGMNLAELWLLKLSDAFVADGEPRRLPADGSYARYPTWIPNGREILYASGIGLLSTIFRMPLDGAAPSRPIEGLGDGVLGPSLSRGGTRLAFSRQIRNSNIWRLDLHTPERPPEPLISSTTREAAPQYSPDGKRIAFYSSRTGVNQIWVCDSDGSRAAQLTSMTGTITGSPRWSPDGRQIALDSNTGGSWQVYVMNADGGRPTPLTQGAGNNFGPSWSADGRWIYFSRGNVDTEIWKVPAKGGEPVRMTTAGGAGAVESADGKTLFFTKAVSGNRGDLWRMPATGGQEVKLAVSMFRSNYAVTPTGVYYGQLTAIQYLDFASGKVTQVYSLPKPIDLGLTLSPDGRYLLFAQNDFSGSDLMLVEHFK